jgi:hypothetical protein
MSRDAAREDRKAPRVRSKGSVRIGDGLRRSHHRVLDLSVGGIRITGAPDWNQGERVSLDINFDALPTAHYAATGCVRRSTADGLAIELDAVSAQLEAYIVEEFVAAAARDGEPTVILVDAKSPARTAIASAFRGHGMIVTEVATPLEAIRRIIEERFDPSVIAIADTVPESVAEQLREFLSGEYPDAYMIAIGASTASRNSADSWIDRDAAHNDLEVRIGRIVTSHDTLLRPLTVPAGSRNGHDVAAEPVGSAIVARGSS